MEANWTFGSLFPSVFDAVSMEAGEGVVQHGCEEPEQSRISAASEEKALSDSEIKVMFLSCSHFQMSHMCTHAIYH